MKGVSFQSCSNRVKFWFICIFLPKFCHYCLPSLTCTCASGEVASLSMSGEERSVVLPHKNSKVTWLSPHLTRYNTIVSQRQIGSGLPAPSCIPSKEWFTRYESADHSRSFQGGKVPKIPRSLLPRQRVVKQSDNVT